MLSKSLSVLAAGALLVLGRPGTPHVDLATRADTLDDGPHVYWRDARNAVVFHLCDGAVETYEVQVSDTLRFTGLCADSATQYRIPAQAPAVPPADYDGVPRILALSDIHGEYDAFVDILQRAGVIDRQLRWTWGNGHVVINGDTFDRGTKVTECLWLIYRLEQEARRAGGRMHMVLGNHELLVLQGDNRYVRDKYLNGIARRARVRHRDLYGPDMELGRWLRTKHSAIRVNSVLFVHGGVSPYLEDRGFDLDDVNRVVRAAASMPSYEVAFSDTARFMLGSLGPLWYRGYHYGQDGRYPRATAEDVAGLLTTYNVTAIVVGHTESDRVEALYDGAVFRIDVPVSRLGGFEALLWEDGRFYRVRTDGERERLR